MSFGCYYSLDLGVEGGNILLMLLLGLHAFVYSMRRKRWVVSPLLVMFILPWFIVLLSSFLSSFVGVEVPSSTDII